MGDRKWRVVLLCFAILVAFSTATWAQETRGRITGRVTDSSKAVVPGASVTATDVDRGTQSFATTNEQGLFVVNYLQPGLYNVAVELQGFKKYIQEKVELEMAGTRDLAIVLEVGGMEETVSVSAELLTVNTSDANLGLVVDQKRLATLPLIHGDPYKIMGLAGGLAHSGSQRLDRPYEPTHIVGYAYQGTRSNRSDLLIDGAPSTATANANEVISTYVPPSDMVQEFKVQTATFDAQFGNTEGGVTSISIKSGTNRLHGSGYYFFEPSGMSANDFFGKARGQGVIKSESTRPGFTVGGPVVIPGLYKGRDKTFFMFGYEHIFDQRPRFDIGGDSWVPTAALRQGDFSAYSSNITIYDPLTRTGTGTYIGQPFPGNIIPANRISPIALKILEYYSMPKSAGLAGNISDSTLPETAKYNNITGRIDQNISNNNRLFARYSWYKRDSLYNDYLSSLASGTNFQFISYQGVIDDVHILNPTTVLNLRYGFNRFERNADMVEAARGFDMTKLGFPSAYNNLVSEKWRRFPRLDFDGTTMVDVAFGNDFRPISTHSAAATVNKTMGAHSLKGGAEMRFYQEESTSTGNNQSGQYAFTNAPTRQSSASGTDYYGLQNYAAFLLGMPNTTSITRSASYNEHSITWGFFVQDDWKVNSRLTLNLGLRYELENPMVEVDNKSVTGFDAAYVQPIQTQVQANYASLNDPTLKGYLPTINVVGGLKYAGVDGGKALYNTPKNTFLPRFGFVYKLNDKTVVRGGGGLFAGFLGQRRGDVVTTGFSQTTTAGVTYNANGAPIPQDWATVWLNTPIIEPVGNAQGRQTFLGQAITFFNQDPKVSKQLRYQVGLQRELPFNTTLDMVYVGNYGYDIEISRNINALPSQYLSTDNERSAAMVANNTMLTTAVTNPFAGLLPGTSFNNATIARSQLLRPYPQFGDITTSTNDGKSWYNSFQASLQKRYAQGYTIGVNYTWSRWMQSTEYLNASDAEPTKMIGDLDVTHRLAISGIFELPFGQGKPFLSNAGPVLEAIVGGWQFQGVFTHQTGFPIAFGTDLFYNGGDIKIDNPTTLKWFNTDAFASILSTTSTLATPVNHKRSAPLRWDDVRRDSIHNVDLSLLKNIKLKNNMGIQLRAEFVNAFNEPYFPAPVVTPATTTFGSITASNQDNYARRAQLGVKFLF